MILVYLFARAKREVKEVLVMSGKEAKEILVNQVVRECLKRVGSGLRSVTRKRNQGQVPDTLGYARLHKTVIEVDSR